MCCTAVEGGIIREAALQRTSCCPQAIHQMIWTGQKVGPLQLHGPLWAGSSLSSGHAKDDGGWTPARQEPVNH